MFIGGKFIELRNIKRGKYFRLVADVFVDDVNWDIYEDGNPEVDPNTPHRKHEKFSKEEGAEIVLVDGTQAIIPPDINVETGEIEITILNDNLMSDLLTFIKGNDALMRPFFAFP